MDGWTQMDGIHQNDYIYYLTMVLIDHGFHGIISEVEVIHVIIRPKHKT